MKIPPGRPTDGALALLAELTPTMVGSVTHTLRALPAADCKAFCRELAEKLLDGGGEFLAHLSDEEAAFCREVIKSRRRLKAKAIRQLYQITRAASGHVLAARLRRDLTTALPANTLAA
jgi:hypothetical protein